MAATLEVAARDLQAKRICFSTFDQVRSGLAVSSITFGFEIVDPLPYFIPITKRCISVDAYYSVKPVWMGPSDRTETEDLVLETTIYNDNLLLCPLTIQNRPVGVLYIADVDDEAKARAFQEAPIYAAIIGVLAENDLLMTARVKKQSALVSLLHSTRSFMTATDVSEILAGIVEEAARLTRSKIAVLITHKPHVKHFMIEKSVGLPEAFLVSSKHVFDRTDLVKEIIQKRYLNVPDVSARDFEEPWYTLMKVSGVVSFIGAVIPADTRDVRELLLFLGDETAWSIEDNDLLLGFLNQSGIAITNAGYLTEIKKATRSAARSRDKLDLILNHIGECIFTIDKGRRIQSANRAFFDNFGKTKGEVIGKLCHQVLGHEGEPCPICPADEVFANGEIVGSKMIKHADKNEQLRDYEVFVYPIKDEFGGVSQAIVAMRDLAQIARGKAD